MFSLPKPKHTITIFYLLWPLFLSNLNIGTALKKMVMSVFVWQNVFQVRPTLQHLSFALHAAWSSLVICYPIMQARALVLLRGKEREGMVLCGSLYLVGCYLFKLYRKSTETSCTHTEHWHSTVCMCLVESSNICETEWLMWTHIFSISGFDEERRLAFGIPRKTFPSPP